MSIASLIYKKFIVKRYDDDHIIKYFTHKDFEGLSATEVSFKTPEGLLCRGNIYAYDGARKDSLVVFCHGIGGGHLSYMREIDVLCKAGYEVLSYDCIGCFSSEGSSIRGMTESINDLVSCLSFIQNDPDLKSRKLSLVGHSWGGFAVGAVLGMDYNVYSACILSTFESLDTVFDYFGDGKLKIFKKGILKFERKVNDKYVDISLSKTLQNTKAKVLFIQSSDDRMLNIEAGLRAIKAKVTNPNVSFVEVSGKGHNPNYTTDAVTYMNSSFGQYYAKIKKKELKTFEQKKAFIDTLDFWRMTEQDNVIWSQILEGLK